MTTLGSWLVDAPPAALLRPTDIEENVIVAPPAVPALHAGNLRAFLLKLLLRLRPLRPATRFPRPGPLMTFTWIGS